MGVGNIPFCFKQNHFFSSPGWRASKWYESKDNFLNNDKYHMPGVIHETNDFVDKLFISVCYWM
jgi:hypothetical protein